MDTKLNCGKFSESRPRRATALAARLFGAVSAAAMLATGVSAADGFCSASANALQKACALGAEEDRLIARANCLNIPGDARRGACFESSRATFEEESLLCGEQQAARVDLCGQLGEQRYAPLWRRADFLDPTTIDASTANAYFPLIPGSVRVYQGEDERITVTVSAHSKLIRRYPDNANGVRCLVVNDLVEEIDVAELGDGESFATLAGVPVEDTDDWYAQDVTGDVWYCGEISRNYEFIVGDEPAQAELVDVEGSWKAFRDSAKPGILVKANPMPGDVYRQELFLGEAEDAAEVLAVDATGLIAGDSCSNADELLVNLTQLFATYCSEGCLVTTDFTPIEPGHLEHKYYARGIGPVLEVGLEDMSCTALVETNLSP